MDKHYFFPGWILFQSIALVVLLSIMLMIYDMPVDIYWIVLLKFSISVCTGILSIFHLMGMFIYEYDCCTNTMMYTEFICFIGTAVVQYIITSVNFSSQKISSNAYMYSQLLCAADIILSLAGIICIYICKYRENSSNELNKLNSKYGSLPNEPTVPVILDESEIVRSPTLCAICSGIADAIFEPCNHSGLCNTCAQDHYQRDPTCPVCNAPIENILKTYP